MMRIGTCHFVSREHAIRYYRPYGNTSLDIDEMIENGSILIGKPKLKPGEKLYVIDDGCRYAIETN